MHTYAVYDLVASLPRALANHVIEKMGTELMKVRLLAGWTYKWSTLHINGPTIHARILNKAIEVGVIVGSEAGDK